MSDGKRRVFRKQLRASHLTPDAVALIRQSARSTSQRDLAAHFGITVRHVLRIQRTATLSGMAKRGYSREFKPHGDTGKRYLLDDIPAGLWASVREKCKRDGVSIRALILKLLKDWTDDTRP